MLQLESISVSFGEREVLKNLSCTVENGDFVVIVGSNGAGKSTFFDTISGRIKPNKGKVFFDKENVTDLGELERGHLITRIFQDTRLNSVGSLTVAQNLAIASYTRRNPRLVDGMKNMPEEKAKQIIEEVGMDPAVLHQPMRSLSGGQRQLIAFVMSTQVTPRLLLLDEPTAALDPQASTNLLLHATRFIKKTKATTILITHDPLIALSVGNKVWVLEDGIIARQYNEEEKQSLRPEDLIGQIDYKQLAEQD